MVLASESGIKAAMPLPSGVQWWIRKDEARPLVRVRASSSLHCFDTDGWVARRTSGP